MFRCFSLLSCPLFSFHSSQKLPLLFPRFFILPFSHGIGLTLFSLSATISCTLASLFQFLLATFHIPEYALHLRYFLTRSPRTSSLHLLFIIFAVPHHFSLVMTHYSLCDTLLFGSLVDSAHITDEKTFLENARTSQAGPLPKTQTVVLANREGQCVLKKEASNKAAKQPKHAWTTPQCTQVTLNIKLTSHVLHWKGSKSTIVNPTHLCSLLRPEFSDFIWWWPGVHLGP